MIKPTFYAAALLAVSSAAFAPMPASAQVDVNLVIGTAPPPLRYESLPPPRHGYVWAPGFWNWNGHRHVWVAGHWLRERPGYYYTQPQWIQSNGHWVRHEGRWDRRGRGDMDRDGIPNRYDRDRDGDGIRLVNGKDSIKPIVDASGGDDAVAESVSFGSPLPEKTALNITLPKGFQDASGRSLRNADSFPLQTATASMPPLAKFAASPFGIVERLAEPDGTAMLPVTLRNVEAQLKLKSLSTATGKVSTLKADTDADIMAWF
eukprot:gene35213-43412_t